MSDENQFLNYHGLRKYNRIIEERLAQVEKKLNTIQESWAVDLGIKINVSDSDVYGFHIDSKNSNPYGAVTYIKDAKGMVPAYMDYKDEVFRYGSWRNVWFIRECRPCVMNQDGTIECYLKQDNYNSDINGNYIDVANLQNANVMIEFPEIWYKVVPDATDDTSGSVYFSKVKLDDGFKNYAYIDKDGNQKEHFYIGAYKGCKINNVLRSISNTSAQRKITPNDFIQYAKDNGSNWGVMNIGERMLINLLLILIGKSLNTTEVFGEGCGFYHKDCEWDYKYSSSYDYSSKANGIKSGKFDKKGLFFGANKHEYVKIFGIENYWGHLYEYCAGDILKNGVRMIKMSYIDSETVIGEDDFGNKITEITTGDYNLDGTGNGYINISAAPTGTSGQYITKAKFNEYGIFPYEAVKNVGSSTTYFCDKIVFKNNIISFAMYGGSLSETAQKGAFELNFNLKTTQTAAYTSARLSYK